MKKITIILVFVYAIFLVDKSNAQENPSDDFTEIRANLLFGINQLLLDGFNIEGNLFYQRWVIDYSHGVSLNFDNAILDDINQAQNLDVHVSWTTGFGVGYRFNDWLNLRAEPKWHRFELYNMGEAQTATNRIASYTTFTMGVGAYANLLPFKKQDNFLKGIMIAPSIRWWPRVSSSLEDNQLTYFNESLDQTVTHEAMEVGINNTPLILNISVGYSLGWNK